MCCRQRCGRLLALVICALGIDAGGAGVASAQTLEIQEEIAASLAEERDTLGFFSWAWRWARTLNTEIDLGELDQMTTLNRSLGSIAEQFARKGRSVHGIVDHGAFEKNEHGAILGQKLMDLSGLPQRVTLGRFLMEMVDQLPEKDVTIVFRHNHFEITTIGVAGRRGWSCYVARRIAPAAPFWFWAGLVAALVFVLARRERLATA